MQVNGAYSVSDIQSRHLAKHIEMDQFVVDHPPPSPRGKNNPRFLNSKNPPGACEATEQEIRIAL